MDNLPNIIWIVWDTCREDFTQTEYRGVGLTPNLSQLAEDSITYDSAFSAAPWTPPSHASMFTGRYPSSHQYLDDGMDLEGTHIAELLSDIGYRTVSISASPKLASHTPLSDGFDTVYELFRVPHAPDRFEEFYKYYGRIASDWAKFFPQYLLNRQSLDYITTSVLEDYVSTRRTEAPLFAFVNYLTTHSKYDPPEPYRSRFKSVNQVDESLVDGLSDRDGFRYMAGELPVDKQEWNAVKDRYAGEVAYADAMLGRLISCLKNMHMYDETMIIVTSDHGEHFGEHQRAYHQFSLYDELLHVPLVVKLPNNEFAGQETTNLVSVIDLFSTILDVVGIPDEQSQCPPIVPPEEINREFVFAEYGRPTNAIENLKKYTKTPVDSNVLSSLDVALQCVRSHTHKLIVDSDNRQEAYDLSEDPNEENNLTENATLPEGFQPLKGAFEDTLTELPDVQPEVPDDRSIVENLEALGYR